MEIAELFPYFQNPHFYPHSVASEIQLIQTHCSAVFLTGEYAYKLKKPVDFGFLDYSTLEKRYYYLTQELVLNQAIAPEIYLSVLPISQCGERLVLGSEENIVEYTLQMAQFPQDCLLVNLYEAGALTAEHIQELGLKVAQFHQSAKVNDYITDFGRIDVIKQSTDENYQTTEKYVGITQDLAQYQATRDFTNRFIVEKRAIFEQRQQQQKIRECHGDLHLKNICYWRNQIHLFDRIEFNEPFRYVDVMYDIAFAVMDLEAKKRQDLANLFLNTYLEQTGDWEGVQLLPFYLSRQAYVRAKVTSMLLDDPQISATDKQQAIATAKDYYHLAWHYTQPKMGRIYVMSGLSGSGKTTVGRYLAQQCQGLQIRSDAIRKQLAGLTLHQTGDASLYYPEMTERTYHRLAELGLLLASQGFTVILDAKYDRFCWRNPLLLAAQQQQIPIQIIHCQASISTLGDRLVNRQGDISDATQSLLPQQQEQWEDFKAEESPYVITLDTENEQWQTRLQEYLIGGDRQDGNP